MFLLPDLAAMSSVRVRPDEVLAHFITEMLAHESRETHLEIERSVRSKQRLAKLIEEEQLISEQHMSYRLRVLTPKWGDTLPDLDSEAIIAAWRRKRGI